ncbi:MAG: hypothetical protein RRC07_04555 [Anaerolineae bacterium]|nr:hypothetical protein [Anaerolineae bacterium]
MSRSQKENTLAALLRDKPRRGRPPREVSRQNVYVALSKDQKETLSRLAKRLPRGFARADVPDLALMVLATRMDGLRRAVAGRTRDIPEGITDLESLYLLWDVRLTREDGVEKRWTSIRVSPQQAIDLGRIHGTLNVLFGATRSDVFALALALLDSFIEQGLGGERPGSLAEMRERIADVYL